MAREGTGGPPGVWRGDVVAAPDPPARALAMTENVSTAESFRCAVARFAEAFAEHETLGGWQRAIATLGRECQNQFGTLALLGEALKSIVEGGSEHFGEGTT